MLMDISITGDVMLMDISITGDVMLMDISITGDVMLIDISLSEVLSAPRLITCLVMHLGRRRNAADSDAA